MILEVADIRIDPHRQAAFEQAVHRGVTTVIAKARGFRGYQVRHGIESPDRYLLLLEWETLEDHTVGFRGSPAYGEWRAIVSEFFVQPPQVEHFEAAQAVVPGAEQAVDPAIRTFSDCHVGIVRMLDTLSSLSQGAAHHPEQRAQAEQVRRFLDTVVPAHHREEEADLFPAVLADANAGDEQAQVRAAIDQLVAEHRHIETLGARLMPSLTSLCKGGDLPLDRPTVNTLLADYRRHAQFEEAVFLPLAQRVLARNSDHMAALGLSLHIRHTSEEVRRRFGFF